MNKSLSVEEIWAMNGSSWMQMEAMMGVRSRAEVRRLLVTHGFKPSRPAKSSFSVGPCLRCKELFSVEFLSVKHTCRACEEDVKKPDPMLEKERRLSRKRMAKRSRPIAYRWTREESKAIAGKELRQVVPE